MVSPRSRGLRGLGFPGCRQQKGEPFPFRDPSQPQEPYHLDAEIPLDETASLLFYTFKGTPIVQVVRRQPQSKNPRTHGPSVIAPLLWLGLIARDLWTRLKKGSGCSAINIALTYSLVRRLLGLIQPSKRVPRSLAAPRQPERTSGVVERPFYIPTSLPEAAREALSLVKRIG